MNPTMICEGCFKDIKRDKWKRNLGYCDDCVTYLSFKIPKQAKYFFKEIGG